MLKLLKLSGVAALLIAVAVAVFWIAHGHRRMSNAAISPEASEWPVGWAADYAVRNSTDPSRNCTGRMYVNALVEPRGMRRDVVCGHRKRISIFSGGTAVIIDPDAKVYWKPHLESRLEAFTIQTSTRETLNGREVAVYEQQLPEPDGTTVKAQVWEDLRLHSPLKVVKPNETIELTNISEGAQPKSLFEIPDGFREVEPPKTPMQ